MTKPTLIEQIGILHADETDGIDLSDQFRPTVPYGIAKACEAQIAELGAERSALPKGAEGDDCNSCNPCAPRCVGVGRGAGYEELPGDGNQLS